MLGKKRKYISCRKMFGACYSVAVIGWLMYKQNRIADIQTTNRNSKPHPY